MNNLCLLIKYTCLKAILKYKSLDTLVCKDIKTFMDSFIFLCSPFTVSVNLFEKNIIIFNHLNVQLHNLLPL